MHDSDFVRSRFRLRHRDSMSKEAPQWGFWRSAQLMCYYDGFVSIILFISFAMQAGSCMATPRITDGYGWCHVMAKRPDSSERIMQNRTISFALIIISSVWV
ncbi:hypothetical protein DER45DRAFT_68874 [Fusarium avenaceum]|nr:hypothetical protein DER45DRAFT_68874 [Fusarium avenaceum]